MKHSPIFSLRLNKLIGRTMRQLQLAKDGFIRFCLRWAVKWLNAARSALRRGDDVGRETAMRRVGYALGDIRAANNRRKWLAAQAAF